MTHNLHRERYRCTQGCERDEKGEIEKREEKEKRERRKIKEETGNREERRKGGGET